MRFIKDPSIGAGQIPHGGGVVDAGVVVAIRADGAASTDMQKA